MNIAEVIPYNQGIIKRSSELVKYQIKKVDPQSQAGGQSRRSKLTEISGKSDRLVRGAKPAARPENDFMLLHRSGLSTLLDRSFGRKTNVFMCVVSQMKYGNMSHVSVADISEKLGIDIEGPRKALNELEGDRLIVKTDHGYMVNPDTVFGVPAINGKMQKDTSISYG